MVIELIRADVTSLKIDAIVNPRPTGGDVGTATVSSGGNVLCKFVITTVVPRVGEEGEERKLRDAIFAALHRAEELAVGSVAFPAFAGAAARGGRAAVAADSPTSSPICSVAMSSSSRHRRVAATWRPS